MTVLRRCDGCCKIILHNSDEEAGWAEISLVEIYGTTAGTARSMVDDVCPKCLRELLDFLTGRGGTKNPLRWKVDEEALPRRIT